MSRHPVLVALLALVAACGPATAEVDDTDAPTVPTPDDTAVTGPTGSPPTATTDTGTPPEPPAVTVSGELVIPLDVVAPEGVVRAVLFDAADPGCCDILDQVELGAMAAGDRLPFALGLPEVPPEEDFVADEAEPLMELAAYAVGAYVDLDGDGLPGAGDTFVAGALDYLGYVRGTLSADAEAAGAELGWNHVAVFTGVATPVADAVEVGEVEGNLLPRISEGPLPATILGTLDAGPVGTRRADLYAASVFLGLPVAAPTLASELVSGDTVDQSFVFDPLPDPPDDHYAADLGDGPIPGAELALYIGVAYVDANNDGAWQLASEVPLADSDDVAPEDRTTLVHARATGFQGRYTALILGGMGWTLFRENTADPDAPPVLLPWGDGIVLQ